MKKQELDQSTLNCVKADLRNAAENGEAFKGWKNKDIAAEMIAYCDTYENWTVENLTPYVIEARKHD